MTTVYAGMYDPLSQQTINQPYTQKEPKTISVISSIAIGILSALAGLSISRLNPTLEFVFYVTTFSSICFAIYHLILQKSGQNTNCSHTPSYDANAYSGHSGGYNNPSREYGYSSGYRSYSTMHDGYSGGCGYPSSYNNNPNNNGWTDFPSGHSSKSSSPSSSGGWTSFDD